MALLNKRSIKKICKNRNANLPDDSLENQLKD